MIWEVDENLDGYVDWEEFQLMYFRNMHDTTGLEPFELFNIVQVTPETTHAPLTNSRTQAADVRTCNNVSRVTRHR